MDIRQKFVSQLGTSLAAGKDLLIREAITRALSCGDWEMGDLTGRCQAYRFPDGREVFGLDGIGIIEFHPTAIEHSQGGASQTIKATMNYRFLIGEKA